MPIFDGLNEQMNRKLALVVAGVGTFASPGLGDDTEEVHPFCRMDEPNMFGMGLQDLVAVYKSVRNEGDIARTQDGSLVPRPDLDLSLKYAPGVYGVLVLVRRYRVIWLSI